MANDFFKLYATIFTGTLNAEPLPTRWLFVAMLSLADSTGLLQATPRYLSSYANITPEEVAEGLDILQRPDPDSSTPDMDGKRIVMESPNVWRIVNFRKYYEMKRGEERKEYMRTYQRNRRAKQHESTDVNNCQHGSTNSTNQKERENERENPPNPRKKFGGNGMRSMQDILGLDR